MRALKSVKLQVVTRLLLSTYISTKTTDCAILLLLEIIIKEGVRMKFKELLAEVSCEVAEYRRDIFNTIILGLIIGTRKKCVYHIFRTFQLLAESVGLTEKRFYIILNSFFREVA